MRGKVDVMLSSVTTIAVSARDPSNDTYSPMQRTVSCALGGRQEMTLQPGKNFLDIANTNGASGGRLETISAGKVHVETLLKVEPLLVSEQLAEGAVSESDGLVSAELLCIIRICSRPVEAAAHGVETAGSVGQVGADPEVGRIGTGTGAEVLVVLPAKSVKGKGDMHAYTYRTSIVTLSLIHISEPTRPY